MSLETKKIFFQKDNRDTAFTNNKKKPFELATPTYNKIIKPLESIAPKFNKGSYNPNPPMTGRATGGRQSGIISSMAPGFYYGNTVKGGIPADPGIGYFQIIDGLSYYEVGYFEK
jgi:hypothetical protein